jgi:uncharacterized protein
MLRKTLLYLYLLLSFVASAERFPEKPSNYVTDVVDYIDEADENLLNAKLKAFEDSSSNQIFVYVAGSLNGEDLQQISQDIFHE